MAIAYVNSAYDYLSASSTTIAKEITGVTEGNALMVVVGEATVAAPSCSIADSGGNSWSSGSTKTWAANYLNLWTFYCLNVTTGGNLTITATFGSSSGYRYIGIVEVSGSSIALDTTSSAQGTSTTPGTGNSVVSDQSIALGGASTYNTRNYTVGSGWTGRGAATSVYYDFETKPFATSTSGVTGNWTISSSDDWIGILLVLKESTSTSASINIGDAWKVIDFANSSINIGDTWKAIAGISINIGDTWKTVYGSP